MLENVRARLSHHVQASYRSIGVLTAKPWTTLMTVAVIASSLILPVLVGMLLVNLPQLSPERLGGGHISLYLGSSRPVDASAVLDRARATVGVAEASLITPAAGLAQLQQQDGMQDIMQYLSDNPLPAVINVMPDSSVNSVDKFDELYQLLRVIPHVEQARFDTQWVSRFYSLRDMAVHIAQGILMVLASAVVLIIGHSLRSVMHSRHEETHVLTFMGASRSYIIRPFLYLGVFYGLAGAVMAIVFVQIIAMHGASILNQLGQLFDLHLVFVSLSFGQAMFWLVLAMILGWIGAYLSVSALRG